MHTAHIILIEADNIDDAMDSVASQLSDGPEWSDWHNANQFGGGESFAGRWEKHFFGEENTRDALCYADDPALAENVIFERLSARQMEIMNLRQQIVKSGFDPLTASHDPYEEGWSMDSFRMRKLLELLDGVWNCDSFIFDLHYSSTNLADFKKRAEANPTKQFLVAVDFHF